MVKKFKPTESMTFTFGPRDPNGKLNNLSVESRGNAILPAPFPWRLKVAFFVAIGRYRPLSVVQYSFQEQSVDSDVRSGVTPE